MDAVTFLRPWPTGQDQVHYINEDFTTVRNIWQREVFVYVCEFYA